MENMPRLKKDYNSRIKPALTEEFGYKNVMQVPELQKIVISKGVGAAIADKKLIDYALMDIKAPKLAKKAMPGQFLIVKVDEFGERIPLTVCDYDRKYA